jgi:hypothetical protein
LLPREIIQALDAPKLTSRVRRAAQASRRVLVPLLCRLLEDPERFGARRASRYDLVNAVALLGELGGADAAAAIVGVLPWFEGDPVSSSVAVEALAGIGAPAVEPLLGAEGPGEGARLAALGRLGARDARVVQRLVSALVDEPRAACEALGRYGDPAAIPGLRAWVAAREVSTTADVIDVAAALQALRTLGAPPDDAIIRRVTLVAQARLEAERESASQAGDVASALRTMKQWERP